MSIEKDSVTAPENTGRCSYVVTLLLAFFLGWFGIHRFYTGYVLIGAVQLVCFILVLPAPISILWALVDLIALALNKYRDSNGSELENFNPGCGIMMLIYFGFSFVFLIFSILVMISSSS